MAHPPRRADSGFWSAAVVAACRRHRIRFSITVRQTKPVTAAIAAIPEHAWVEIDYPDGGIAQVAETTLGGQAGGRPGLVTAKTVRRRFLALPGRLTCSARRRTLHLPIGWPWARAFVHALGRLQTIRPPAWAP